ncbi:hypothetical protein [Thiosulfativibrio zosterae]|uniref:Uncharacterized protein n=1 Tax=Thiosulfativibrio zosterae TaxID=2675053 RepID=A0A6F8PPM1_9GAMM|nr:hypothetical protein [Thiosulfativibrio zosterae]BBP44071.1 hypothetical protein THMIRHAT_18170 [Thiosulfativibrio zosterae]
MKLKNALALFSLGLSLSISSLGSFAENAQDTPVSTVTPYTRYPETKIFMTEKQRMEIEKMRSDYLDKNNTAADAIKMPVKTVVIVLPEKIEVSSIVINPDGLKKVRVNGAYHTPKYKDWWLDLKHTSEYEAAFSVAGKLVKVPVGSTYWVSKKTLVKTVNDEDLPAVAQADNDLSKNLTALTLPLTIASLTKAEL